MWASFLLASVFVATAFAACPDGYWHYPDRNVCLKAYKQKRSFFGARNICQNDGGDLVQIKDRTMEKSIGMKYRNYPYYWIGVWDQKGYNHFSYVDGSYLRDYEPWAYEHSHNYNGRPNCVASARETFFEWIVVDCRVHLNFVCEQKYT